MRIIHKTPILVIVCSLLLGLGLTAAAWDMNFWPSDEKAYYFDAAVQLPHLQHLSEIHKAIDSEKVRWLHGKEIFILLLSLMQRLMGDTQTIRPFLVLGVLGIGVSSVLIYFIARRFWGAAAALVCYGLFTFSMWPYVYVLFAKHQTAGLMFFLLAVWLGQLSGGRLRRAGVMCLSGLAMGLSFFSSTVSVLYVPLYMAAFVWGFFVRERQGWVVLLRGVIIGGLAVLAGFVPVFLYVNWPDVGGNVKSWLEYVSISGAYNHFFYNQPHLQQWFPNSQVAQARGGWLWVASYFQVVMPVAFPLYLISALWLFFRRQNSWGLRLKTILMIGLSLLPVVMAEKARVAQYGANYFPALISVVMLTGYAVSRWQEEAWKNCARAGRRFWLVAAGLTGAAHIAVNLFIFSTDVFPTRMVTTFLSRKIQSLGIKKIYTYPMHPHRDYFAAALNPQVSRNLTFGPIRFLAQAQDGYILVPPITGDSIYLAAISDYADFDSDVFLNELVRQRKLEEYAAGSFSTMANSRIWRHEEEIISYRDLILRQQFPDDELKGRVWLLDGQRLHADRSKVAPSQEEIALFQENRRNIGTRTRRLLYNGEVLKLDRPQLLSVLLAPIYKVGNPDDALQVYIYKLDDKQTVWVPMTGDFISTRVPGSTLSDQPELGMTGIRFDPPLKMLPGPYRVMIYRTGAPDDRNFYRLIVGGLKVM